MALFEIPSDPDLDFSIASKKWKETISGNEIPGDLEIRLDRNSFVKVDGLAFLTAHCLDLKNKGTNISITGDYGRRCYLQRMGFHKILGVNEEDLSTNPEIGRFIPISLIQDGDDVAKTVNLICELVIRQFKDGVKFVPAMEWAVNELIDNIVIHAESPVPGVVCAQSYPQLNQLSIAICDMGRGISGSLATTREIESDTYALEQALTRGVTRDPEVGQGNGMAGSLEICRANEGSLSLWSGGAMFNMLNGKENATNKIDRVQGTGLCLQMKTDNPVDLRDTWIAGGDWSYIDASAQELEEKGGINVAAECANTGSRPPAKYLRRKIEAVLPEMEAPLALNFSDVKSASSSFLDELLGRLSVKFGTDVFKEKVRLHGMTETVRRIANVVIAQRAGEIEMKEETKNENTSEQSVEIKSTPNAWLVKTEWENPTDWFSLDLPYAGSLFSAISALREDILILLNKNLEIIGFGRLYRKRAGNENTGFYFDRIERLENNKPVSEAGFLKVEEKGITSRVVWPDFQNAYKVTTGKDYAGLPMLDEKSVASQNYARRLVKLAAMDDLLGPACGPEEEIVGMSVRDRYLVGKLAPRKDGDPEESIEGLQGAGASEEEETEGEPDDLKPFEKVNEASRQAVPGQEFGASSGKAYEPDDDDSSQIDAAKNQSFVPSSVGMTVCVDAGVRNLEIEANWGRYTKQASEIATKEDGTPLRAWKRRPAGGKIQMELKPGWIKPIAIDGLSPNVCIQGVIREDVDGQYRMITIFLVNNQVLPKENQDEAWVFQPEIIVRDQEGGAIFCKRPIQMDESMDEIERATLEMIYRKQVEFAVGHTISVHASPTKEDPEKATEIRTQIIPEYEVPTTETPGLNPEDRPEMQRMVKEGFLDMRKLAAMDKDELQAALTVLTSDYETWISEQEARVGPEVIGHDRAARVAMDRCRKVLERLREGIDLLRNDPLALQAFQFANLAMADQRVHGMLGMETRRGSGKELKDLNIPKNHSWRPFQLAFILLSIPSLANPKHKDRSQPLDSFADLLWFPTGGGKTEAYLGVAAFTMGIRRLQGNLGGYDASRGLSVIMRYTLRLLTLQQFQRATTLICAMEIIRRKQEQTWGKEPFTIGLWVGGAVTPNKTEQSEKYINQVRNGQRTQGSSPCQINNCPWCGSEVLEKRDVKVSKFAGGHGRTLIFCGDKLSKCEFTQRNSPNLGIPMKVVDEEIYRKPPSMMIATVDKFAQMAWNDAIRNLFGIATHECSRHGLTWPDCECKQSHKAQNGLPAASTQAIPPIRPPDLIIQDEFHLISGPLGTMVGLYETVVDELSTWQFDNNFIRPKIIASTATVRRAQDQVNNVFMRKVAIFPPNGLDVEDNFFSVQRSIKDKPGRQYLGICSPGSARPAVLIRLYTALLTASQDVFRKFGKLADPWMTSVGYFNSLRELGGMKRLAEDDVQTRSFRVEMGHVSRPGLKQRKVNVVEELTSRVSSASIPQKLDTLEIQFRADYDSKNDVYDSQWQKEETRAIDIVLATNMLSVGVDVNRLGLMLVNGQPKNTAEYIQATSRVGRSFPGLVFTSLTWARPRDLSHYESFEHYHSAFYKHVEAQSVTPFTPRALDRGLTGGMVSMARLKKDPLAPNLGAESLTSAADPTVDEVTKSFGDRAHKVTDKTEIETLAKSMSRERFDEWIRKVTQRQGHVAYKAKRQSHDTVSLLEQPGSHSWSKFTVPTSMREVEPGVRLVMQDMKQNNEPGWKHPVPKKKNNDQQEDVS